MKLFVAVLFAVLAASANAGVFYNGIDLSKIAPEQEHLGIFNGRYHEAVKKTDIAGRIVGGDLAVPHQFPFMVAIFTTKPLLTVLCGGSVIGPNVVLTSANCLVDGSSSLVIAGANNRNINEVNQQRRTIALGAYRIHADYNPTLVLNDIATMITTPQTFTFNQFVQGIVLATGDESFAGEMATATGFGRTSDTATATSAQVRFVNQPVITNAACLAAYGIVIDAHICMSTAGGRGTCTGDGGGPLFIVRDGSFLQIGVGSFLSAAGCEAGFPSGFTRVTSFTAWIAANRS